MHTSLTVVYSVSDRLGVQFRSNPWVHCSGARKEEEEERFNV